MLSTLTKKETDNITEILFDLREGVLYSSETIRGVERELKNPYTQLKQWEIDRYYFLKDVFSSERTLLGKLIVDLRRVLEHPVSLEEHILAEVYRVLSFRVF